MKPLNREIFNKVKKEIGCLLLKDNSGHGLEHAEHVAHLASVIAVEEGGERDVIELAALLHDVDDYKLFGENNAENLLNARIIMTKALVPEYKKQQVLNVISTIGYSKRLKGVVPDTLEAKIVSDADMLEAMGVTGILRVYQYNLAKGKTIFDPNIWPDLTMSADEYKANKNGTAINHVFEKLLKLKDLMLTERGKELAEGRHEAMISFLYNFFIEQNALEWVKYLDAYQEL